MQHERKRGRDRSHPSPAPSKPSVQDNGVHITTHERTVFKRCPRTGRAKRLVLKIDDGSQFVARQFVEWVRILGIEQDVDRPYTLGGNGLQEPF